jgi:hypothetical protein
VTEHTSLSDEHQGAVGAVGDMVPRAISTRDDPHPPVFIIVQERTTSILILLTLIRLDNQDPSGENKEG